MEAKDPTHFRDELLQVQLIRWDHLPDFGIYSDQVLTIIESQLSFLHLPKGEPVITPTMINNYVKQGIIDRPVKKKYYKAHIAKLIVISLLKQVLPLGDIQKGIELQVSLKGVESAYNSFCEELEESLRLFAGIGMEKNGSLTFEGIRPDNLALKMVTLSVVSKLLTQTILSMNGLTNKNYEQGEISHEKQ